MASETVESPQSVGKTNGLRIAWLLPSAVLYWQPLLKEFTQQFPQTLVFTAHWLGFIQGCEECFAVETVGQRKYIKLGDAASHYDSGLMYLPPSIVAHLLRFKPSVIFTNSFGLWTVLALLSKPLGRWKVVVAYEGSSPGVDYRNSSARLLLRRMLVSLADALITNSQAGKAYLTEILAARADKVFLNPYEVPDPEALLHHAQALDSSISQLQHPVFLYVGKMIPRKGLPFLLQACAHLNSQGYQNYTLLLIGDGPQRGELEAFSREHHICDRLKWTGQIAYDRLGSYLRDADVFVFPTLEDTWGMVLLEAMTLGKPVLCSKLAGAADLVTNGKNGYCFEPQNPKELAEAMRRFIDCPDLITSMGRKSKQLMAQHTPKTAVQFLKDVTTFVLK